jgi:hypothetical protein
MDSVKLTKLELELDATLKEIDDTSERLSNQIKYHTIIVNDLLEKINNNTKLLQLIKDDIIIV